MRNVIMIGLMWALTLSVQAQFGEGPVRDGPVGRQPKRAKTAIKKVPPPGTGASTPLDTTRSGRWQGASADTRRTNEWVFSGLPVYLNGSNIDPSPVSNLSVDLAGQELRVKIGFPGTFKHTTKWKNVRWFTASLSPYTSSKDQKSTLYSKGSWTGTLGVDAGVNFIPVHMKWTATEAGVKAYEKWSRERVKQGVDDTLRKAIKVNELVSDLVGWFALRGNVERKVYQLFYPGSAFADLSDKRRLGLGRGYVSVNMAFTSNLQSKRWWTWLLSAGYGKGSFTNYLTLPERTLQEGAVVYNADSSAVRIISEETAGRVGPMVLTEGNVAYVEAYKSVFFFRFAGDIRLGARFDWMAIGTEQENTRFAPGIFINVKKPGKKAGDEPVDAVNVALIYQMDQFQLEHNEDYWNTHASLMVNAAFPLRFK